MTPEERLRSLSFLRPGILQRDRPVPHLFRRSGIRIKREVAKALELITLLRRRVGKRWFAFRGHNVKRMGIDERFKIARRVRLDGSEKPIIKSNFGVIGLGRAYPVDGPLYFAIRGCATRLTIEIDRAPKLVTLPELSFTTSSHLMM